MDNLFWSKHTLSIYLPPPLVHVKLTQSLCSTWWTRLYSPLFHTGKTCVLSHLRTNMAWLDMIGIFLSTCPLQRRETETLRFLQLFEWGGGFEYGREEVISCSFESLLGRQETSSETFPVVQEGGDLFGRIQCEAWPLRLAWNFCQQECAVSTGGQWHAACLQISLVGRGNCVQLWNWREPWGCPVCGWAEHSEG